MQQADGQILIRAEMDTSSVTAGIHGIQSALDALRVYAARQFASIRSQVQTEGDALGGWMPGLASRLIGALTSGLSGGGTRITNALRGTLASAYAGGNAYVPRFSSIGSYVISGIISGIQGSASALWNTLREVAANMLNTLKSALGIHSPSQVMREEIGRQIGAGIAEGMLDSHDAIASAAEALVGDAAVGTGKHSSRTVIASASEILADNAAVSVGDTKEQMRGMSGEAVYMAGELLRAASRTPASNVTAVQVTPIPVGTGSTGQGTEAAAPTLGGNTFIFQKPVETPYRHAQAIREVMEEMLYGT